MLLAHRIRLDPRPAQRDYFARAAGTARRAWNWAVAEWARQRAAGLHSNAMVLKKQFNAIKYADPAWLDVNGLPWLRIIHPDAHAQPFANLARALTRYSTAWRGRKPAYPPVFRKKGCCRDSFYVANDKLRLDVMGVVLPKVGRVALQVDVPEQVARCSRSGDGVTGVDLGVSSAATLSSGEKVAAPRPLKAALRRLRIRSRRQSRKLEAAKVAAGMAGGIPKGTRLPVSNNRNKDTRALARLHACIARVRKDFLHKLTTRLCRENRTVAIEDLNVRGMLANARLARAIADVGFYAFRQQLQYKALRYGTTLVLADRWYPSSKLCSGCGVRNGKLRLGERAWTCRACGAHHERDVNAAINLQRLATGALVAQSALPVASPAATPGTPAGMGPAGGGKVTPVSEYGQQDGSGQEENGAHL